MEGELTGEDAGVEGVEGDATATGTGIRCALHTASTAGLVDGHSISLGMSEVTISFD